MKVNRKEIEKLYDGFFAEAVAVIEQYNPCKVRKCRCGVVCTEWRARQYPGVYHFIDDNKPNDLCCGGCKHHDRDRGCHAEKPLACKLWLCYSAEERYPGARKKLEDIQERAENVLGPLLFRGDRKDSIDHIIEMGGLIDPDLDI